ncbi:MAG: Ribonucleoside-diphosphate reductase [Parcubacteria group bacterium GW2011_GWB1_41_6]|nr:MAG: Ribonucleoside-diphosphate reductase [Parcubacteria group bacterium GW2011_GWB1_41_6]
MPRKIAPKPSPQKISSVPKKIKKRDGRIVDFQWTRIADAVFKAFEAKGEPNRQNADETARKVAEKLAKKYKNKPKAAPDIEEVQDLVEETLIEKGFAKIAKAYILYREKRAEIRREKQMILNKEEIDEVDKRFDLNALRVLKSRYLRKDPTGRVIESPKQLFQRVAIHTALPELIYDPKVSQPAGLKKKKSNALEPLSRDGALALGRGYKIGQYELNPFHLQGLSRLFSRFDKEGRTKISWKELLKKLRNNEFKNHAKTIDEFYELMISRRFMPNTPAIANFGNYLGMGSACFALDIDDSIESIMGALTEAAIVFKSGGGLGYNFSKLRPEGDFIKTTGGTSSGPLSFMRLFDTMTEVVKQGGIRRGANMGIMNSNHPDIEKFVSSKEQNKALKNFNISVMLMPDFWEHLKKDKPYALINPRTGETVREISPKLLFDSVAYHAWESGEPGVVFHDTINKYNPFLEHLGPIQTTNPCGEVILYPNESCNLGSINIWAFLKENGREKKFIDWKALEQAVYIATKFLDNVIDINIFPLPKIEEMSLKTRKIGLGVMGIGDAFFSLQIPFNSPKSRDLMEKIMEFVNYHSKVKSMEIAQERGSFPYFGKSFFKDGQMPFSGFYEKKSWSLDWGKLSSDIKKHGLRNGYTTVIAPTGSISMIAGCSSGIEPVYALVFKKNVAVGSFYYIDPVFEKAMLREGLFDEVLIEHIADHNGSLQKISYIPPAFKKIFVAAHDISPDDHIRTLAAFQKWTDSSISKTNNFPAGASVEDVKKSYILAHDLGCKAVTVFRDKSIKNQVLVSDEKEEKVAKSGEQRELVRVKDEKAEGLSVYHNPAAGNPFIGNGNGNGNSGLNGVGKSATKCPSCSADLSHQEGCVSCPICGWGLCV